MIVCKNIIKIKKLNKPSGLKGDNVFPTVDCHPFLKTYSENQTDSAQNTVEYILNFLFFYPLNGIDTE